MTLNVNDLTLIIGQQQIKIVALEAQLKQLRQQRADEQAAKISPSKVE